MHQQYIRYISDEDIYALILWRQGNIKHAIRHDVCLNKKKVEWWYAYGNYEAEDTFPDFYLKLKVLLLVEKILPLSP